MNLTQSYHLLGGKERYKDTPFSPHSLTDFEEWPCYYQHLAYRPASCFPFRPQSVLPCNVQGST